MTLQNQIIVRQSHLMIVIEVGSHSDAANHKSIREKNATKSTGLTFCPLKAGGG